VRKRLPEEAAQIRVRVADQPKGDGNVGVEEMVRALGLSTDNKGAFPKSPPSSEGEDEGSATADATDGHKALDVRVEWARTFLLPSLTDAIANTFSSQGTARTRSSRDDVRRLTPLSRRD
jgi:hypothetical protein